MKHFFYYLTALLLIGGVSTVNAENVTADFNSGLPEGWTIVGELTNNDDRARSGKGIWTSAKSNTDNYLVTGPIEGSLSLYWRSYGTSGSYPNGQLFVCQYSEGALGGQIWASSTYKSSTWKSETVSLGDYHGQVAIVLYSACIDDVTYTPYENVSGPALTVKDGSMIVSSPYSFDFGLVSAGTTHEFTLSNPGNEDIQLSVSETGNFGAVLSTETIEAGGKAMLTITMPEATTSSAITITPSVGTIDPFVINASGTVKDPKKMFEDFSGNELPDSWSTVAVGSSSASYSWSFANGYASYSQGTNYGRYYDQALVSPVLTFQDNEQVFFKAMKVGYSNPYMVVEYSADGTNWTATDEGAFNNVFTSSWASYQVTVPATAKQIRFNGCCFAIDDIYGGEPSAAPNLKFTATDYSFGMIVEETTSTLFTIQNTGLSELTGLSVTSSNENFIVTVTDNATAIAAKGSATFTVTMKATVKGLNSGVITVKADGFDPINFNVTGYLSDDNFILVNFEDNEIPENWVNSGFKLENNELYTTYSTCSLTSPSISVGADQALVLFVKGGSTYTAQLRIKTSSDNGNTWTTAKEFTTELRQNTTDYVLLTVDNIAAGNYLLQIEGSYITIKAINGYSYNMNAPVLVITPNEPFAAGKVTANAEKTYTVSNQGTGTLTVNIASDNEKFTVSPTQLTVTDEPKTFIVTFNYEEQVYGTFAGNITVTPTYDEKAYKTIAVSATAKNPNLWDEDFEEGALPNGWETTNWIISTFPSYENQTKMALAPNSQTAGTLTTPCLQATQGDVLTWDAYLNWYDEYLIVEYSNDDKATWNTIYNYASKDDSEAPSASERYYHKAMRFTAPADGHYYLRFTSTYQNGVDNFSGFKLFVKEHDAQIVASNIPATGNEDVAYTASVDVKVIGTSDEELTVSFFIGSTQYGESVVKSVAANATETFSVTFTPTSAISGDAYFTVSNSNITLTSDKKAVTITGSPLLDEENGSFEGFTNYGNYPVVKLKYSMTAGWNTLILPFSVDDLSIFGTNTVVYELSSCDDNDLKLKSVTRVNPQTPYIVKADTEKNIFVFTNVVNFRTNTDPSDLNTTKGSALFQGFYAPQEAGSLTDKYILAEDKDGLPMFVKATGETTLKGFRVYMELPKADMGIYLDNELVTGIHSFSKNDTATKKMFNLNGQQVETMQKGSLYIINGKKVLNK